MDAGNLPMQTLASSAAKALKGLSTAREYMRYGFTTLRDLGSADPVFPTVDLRNALAAGIVGGPRLIVAAHIISASGDHGGLRGFYGSRWALPVSTIAGDPGSIKALVRREHTFGSDWIKTTNTGGYFSLGDDPARLTWFDEEMDVLVATARQLGMSVAVRTGAAAGGRQAIRAGARSLERAHLIDAEAIAMAEKVGTWVVPTMQMAQEDLHSLHAHMLACQAAWKLSRDNGQIVESQRLIAKSEVKMPTAPTAACFPSATASWNFRPWWRQASGRYAHSRPQPASQPTCSGVAILAHSPLGSSPTLSPCPGTR